MCFKKKIKNKPENLYLEILKIGSECVSCGIKYQELKDKLISKNIIKSDDPEETLKILFENSFSDRDSTCDKPYLNELVPCGNKFEKENNEHYLYKHLENCKHYLTPESLMHLLNFNESKNNLTATKSSKKLGIIAISIAILSTLTPLVYDKCYTSSELKELKEIKSNGKIQKDIIQNELIPMLKQTNEKLINLNDAIHHNQYKNGNLQLPLYKAPQSTKKVQ